MKRPQITDGEWQRQDNLIFALTPYVGNSPQMAKACPDGINRFSCLVQQDNSEASGGAPKAELEANARFIAASKKMAEALELAINCPLGCAVSLRIMQDEARSSLIAAGYEF